MLIQLIFYFKNCSSGFADFRQQQCSEFNNQVFMGRRFTWEPYIKGM